MIFAIITEGVYPLRTERNSMELNEILVMIMVIATVTNMGRGTD